MTEITTTKTTKTYFDGKTAEQITTALRGQAKRVMTDVETFGAMIVEAHGRQVHTELGQTWPAYCEDVLGGFKPDTIGRKVLGAMMRAAGMENKEVAAATGATEKTVKRDNAERGDVNANRQAAQKAAQPAKPAKPAALDDAQVIKYIRDMTDHARVARMLRVAGYADMLVPEYRTDPKPATVPAPKTPADAKPTDTKVRSVRRAGQHRQVIGTRPLASV